MLFSVVIPVYNKLPHLERSISSVLNQSFTDFELILIDDASTDGSSEKLKQLNGRNIRIFSRDAPGPGGYAARNLGIKEARGEWVAFLDADDEWFPDHLEKMNQLTEEFPQVHLMSCGYQRQKDEGKTENKFYRMHKGNGNLEVSLKNYLTYSLLKQNPICTSVAFVRNTSPIVRELFPVKWGAERGGDLHAWLKLMSHYKKMAWSDHIGAIYHHDSLNMVTRNAKASPQLMSKRMYDQLSYGVDFEEKKLLKIYFNFLLKMAWLQEVRDNDSTFELRNRIFFKNIYLNGLEIYFVSTIPKTVIRYFYSLVERIKTR